LRISRFQGRLVHRTGRTLSRIVSAWSAKGLLKTEWDRSEKQSARKIYELTAKGRKRLQKNGLVEAIFQAIAAALAHDRRNMSLLAYFRSLGADFCTRAKIDSELETELSAHIQLPRTVLNALGWIAPRQSVALESSSEDGEI